MLPRSSTTMYVALPSLSPQHSSPAHYNYLSTYAPPVKQPSSILPAAEQQQQDQEEEEKQQLPLSQRSADRILPASPSLSSSPEDAHQSSYSTRPPSSVLHSSSHSRNASHRLKRTITFTEHLPSLTSSPSHAHADILIIPNADSPPTSAPSSPSDTSVLRRAELVLLRAEGALAEGGSRAQDATSESRRRQGMLATLKRADRERVDMARDLYDEVQIALSEQAREEEERRREEHEERDRADERKRLKDDKRREKREAQLIQALTPQQMINILDSFPQPHALTHPSSSSSSSPAPLTLQAFLSDHYSLRHLMFTEVGSGASRGLGGLGGWMGVDWAAPPRFHHVLSRRLTATDLPSFLHSELDSLDPSSSAMRSFLSSWLRSYHEDRPAFSSLVTFLSLKLTEITTLTAPLASPNSLVTFISIDAALLLLSASSMCESPRAQVVLTLLLDIALLAVYAKQRNTGSGHVEVADMPWAVRVRVLEGELAARRDEHRDIQRRMQAMHEQWVRVLNMWQPCVARAVHKWQMPIKALAFNYWQYDHRITAWRRADAPTRSAPCQSMTAMLATMRTRWARRNDARVAFLEWRQLSILSRLGMLRDELRKLDGINADKTDELDCLAATAARYRASIDSSERDVEEAQLRIRMMLVQHDEYSEQLESYDVQEDETARLVALFSALMIRAVEEFELALVQLFYQRAQDVGRIGDVDAVDEDDAEHDTAAAVSVSAAAAGAGESKEERKKKSRLLLAGLLSKKKASGSKKSKRAHEQDNRSFLRVWTRIHYSRFAHLFPASAPPRPSQPADHDLLVAAAPPAHARRSSLVVPITPAAFVRAPDTEGADGSSGLASSRRRHGSVTSSASATVDVAAAFLNALRQQTHDLFPMPPFSHDSAFLYHHSHPPLPYEAERALDELTRRKRELDRTKHRHDATVDPRTGLPVEVVGMLRLSHAGDVQQLRSFFSFLPDVILPPSPMVASSPSAYSLPFVVPATVRAHPFLLHSIALFPSVFASSSLSSSSPPPHQAKVDFDLLNASCLYLLQSLPATPFDLDDELSHLQELVHLTRHLAHGGRSAFLRLHSDVMRVVLVNVRQWRRRMKKRREETRASDALWGRHVRRAEDDVTRRLMRRIREKETVMKAANVAYERAPVQEEAAGAGGVEAAFGEVRVEEAEVQLEIKLDARTEADDTAARSARKKSLLKEKQKGRRKQAASVTPSGPATARSGTEEAARSGSAGSGGDVSEEYEQEKAEEDAEIAHLHYDCDRLREIFQHSAERMRAKAAEDREKKDKKAKKATKGGGKDTADGAAATTAGEGGDGETRADEADYEEVDALAAEDENAQCEEAVQQYLMDLRRVYRNACDTDDGASSASVDPGSAGQQPASSSARAASQQWLMTKTGFGRFVRRYKILSKTCSAQFIDGLWDDKQASKRTETAAAGWTGADADGEATTARVVADDGVISFDDFLELLVRIAVSKYGSEATLLSRLTALLSRDLFPAVKGPSPLADFRTVLALTCEPVFDKHSKFLSAVFRAYSSDRESSGGVQEPAMTRRDFDEFIEHTQLLQRKTIAVRTVAVLWGSAQMDEEGDGGDTTAALFGGSSSMVYWEFLEAIAALACYYERDPLLPVDSRLELFVDYLQDGCSQVETKRRMYAAKLQGEKGSGGVVGAVSTAATGGGAAAAKGKGADDAGEGSVHMPSRRTSTTMPS